MFLKTDNIIMYWKCDEKKQKHSTEYNKNYFPKSNYFVQKVFLFNVFKNIFCTS